jgi:hypothetical protein
MTRLSVLTLFIALPVLAAEPSPVADFLKRPLLPADETVNETRDYLRLKIPRLYPPGSEKSAIMNAAEWEKEAERIRQQVLANVIIRGQTSEWRNAKTRVETLDAIPCEGSRIKKLRCEILPGFWIPSPHYEPDTCKPCVR